MKALAQKKKKEKPPLFKLGDYDIVNVVILGTGQTFENWTGDSPIDVREAKIGDTHGVAVQQDDKVSIFINTPLVIECKVPEQADAPKKPEEEDEYIVPEE